MPNKLWQGRKNRLRRIWAEDRTTGAKGSKRYYVLTHAELVDLCAQRRQPALYEVIGQDDVCRFYLDMESNVTSPAQPGQTLVTPEVDHSRA